MPTCEVCKVECKRVAAFCPNCGAPLSTLAARLREADARPAVVVLPEAEEPADLVVLSEDEAPDPTPGSERRR